MPAAAECHSSGTESYHELQGDGSSPNIGLHTNAEEKEERKSRSDDCLRVCFNRNQVTLDRKKNTNNKKKPQT